MSATGISVADTAPWPEQAHLEQRGQEPSTDAPRGEGTSMPSQTAHPPVARGAHVPVDDEHVRWPVALLREVCVLRIGERARRRDGCLSMAIVEHVMVRLSAQVGVLLREVSRLNETGRTYTLRHRKRGHFVSTWGVYS